MAEELLMEDETQDRNTGQMAAIRIEQEQVKPQKPVTLNSLMMDKMDSIEGMIGSLADITTIKMLVIACLVIGLLCLAGTVYLMTEVSFLLGRITP